MNHSKSFLAYFWETIEREKDKCLDSRQCLNHFAKRAESQKRFCRASLSALTACYGREDFKNDDHREMAEWRATSTVC